MTHKRSFKRMSADELFFKQFLDSYKSTVLTEPFFEPIKKWGLDGLDEVLFNTGKRLTFTRQKEISKLKKDKIRIENELKNRGIFRPSVYARSFVEKNINPATFNVFSENIEGLRKERIKKMKNDGVPLYTGEKYSSFKTSVNDFGDVISKQFGDLDDFVQHNKIELVAGLAIVAGSMSGYNWAISNQRHEEVAQYYMKSHEVGSMAFAVKRDAQTHVNNAAFHLTYTPKIKFKIDNSDVTIPEKPSSPQLGMRSILSANNIVKINFSDIDLEKLVLVSSEDKNKVASYRDAANNNLLLAANSLNGAINTKRTYATEIGLSQSGYAAARKGVTILETYMDKQIVKKETDTHKIKTVWKWATYILGGFGLITAFPAARNMRNRTQRKKYYSNYY